MVTNALFRIGAFDKGAEIKDVSTNSKTIPRVGYGKICDK